MVLIYLSKIILENVVFIIIIYVFLIVKDLHYHQTNLKIILKFLHFFIVIPEYQMYHFLIFILIFLNYLLI